MACRKSRGGGGAAALTVHNATCPLVTKVHNQAKKYVTQGRMVILIGHAGHPEVEGTLGQVAAPVTLIQTEDDVGGPANSTPTRR